MFRFRLDTILRYRAQMEESEKREMGKIRARLTVEKNKKELFRNNAAKSGLSLDNKKEAGQVTSYDCYLHGNFVEGTKRWMSRQDTIIKDIEKKLEDQRKKVVEAMKKRKILATLKSGKYEEYLLDDRRDEQKFLDEIVSTRWKPEEF